MSKYARGVVSIMKDISSRLPNYLNMQNEEHATIVSEYFGGVNIMKQEYPYLYQNYAVAKETSVQDMDYTGYCDGAVITSFVRNNDNKLDAIGHVNLTKRASKLFVSLSIMKNDIVIKQENQVFSNKSVVKINCLSDSINISGDEEIYKAYLHVSWQAEGEVALRSMLAQSTEITINSPLTVNSSLVQNMVLMHPTKIPHTSYDNISNHVLPSDKIIVAYNRSTSQGNVEKIDYSYSDSRDVSGLQKVFLDISFRVVLKNQVVYAQKKDLSAILLGNGLGDVFYLNNTSNAYKIKEQQLNDGSTELTIIFNNDWCNTISQSVKAGNRLYDFFAEFSFYAFDMETNKTHIIETKVSSMNDYEATNVIKVQQIYLFWGCLAEGTLILMTDGSEKEIQTIAKGDKLLNSKGETVTVTNVIMGSKEIIYHTYTESGKKISATLLHPFATASGDMLLRNFQAETRLMVKNADEYIYELIENCYPEQYSGTVYSLEVDGGSDKTIIANGFVTYANSEVNRIEQMEVENDLVLSCEEQKEYNLLKIRLENRKIDV